MLDFEYAKALEEVVLDTTCSEKEREVRLECSTQIFGRANAYLKKGFLPDVVEAFFVRKMKGLPLVSTKQVVILEPRSLTSQFLKLFKQPWQMISGLMGVLPIRSVC